MAIKVHCYRCLNELDDAGALLFSPPLGNDVTKHHVCKFCWALLLNWLRASLYSGKAND